MPHLQLKRYLAACWPLHKSPQKMILLYHSIGKTPWGMPVQYFKDQIAWLRDHADILTLTELIHAAPSGRLQVALTFDDGYHSLYEHAAALTEQEKIKPTVYLNTGWIAPTGSERRASVAALGHYPDEYFLNWHEVEALQGAGWGVGSHGVNHYNFACTDVHLTQQELLDSKLAVENRLQIPCLHFSYPWGQYTTQLKEQVKAIGYQYAVAARHGYLDHRADYFALPRINIAKEYSFADFKNILRGKWDYLSFIQQWRGL